MKYTHVAPEVATGTHPPSHASDVYALGCLLRQIAAKIGCKPPLSLSECCLKNDPNARASLDHLLVSVKSLIIIRFLILNREKSLSCCHGNNIC